MGHKSKGIVGALALLFCLAMLGIYSVGAVEDEPNPNAYQLLISADRSDLNTGDTVTLRFYLRRAPGNEGGSPVEQFRFKFNYDSAKLAYVEGSAQALLPLPGLRPENTGFDFSAADGVFSLGLQALGEPGWDVPSGEWEEIPAFAQLSLIASERGSVPNFPLVADGESVITNGEYRFAADLDVISLLNTDIRLLNVDENAALNSTQLAQMDGMSLTQGQVSVTFTHGLNPDLTLDDDAPLVFQVAAVPGYEVIRVAYRLADVITETELSLESGSYSIAASALTGKPVTVIVYTRMSFSLEDFTYFTDAGVTPDSKVFRPYSAITGSRCLVLLKEPAGDSIGYLSSLTDWCGTVFAFPTEDAPYPGYTHGLLVDLTASGCDAMDKEGILAYLQTVLTPSDTASPQVVYDYNTNGLPGARLLDVQAAYDFSARSSVRWNVDEALVWKADVVGKDGAARDGRVTSEDVLCYLRYAWPF